MSTISSDHRELEALEGLESDVRARPLDGRAWGRLGRWYHQLGKSELALHALRRAAELGTPDGYAWRDLSLLLEHAGEKAEALAAAYRAARLAGESPGVLVHLGTQLLNEGRPHEAILYLEKATLIDPVSPEPIGVLGLARYDAHQFAAAAECLEAALQEDPEVDVDAWGFLGVSLDASGRSEGAVHALETAVFAKPDWAWAWAHLGRALRKLDRHSEAVAAFQKAIDHGFAPASVWTEMGSSAAEVGDLARLERASDELRALDPEAARLLEECLKELKASNDAVQTVTASEAR